MITLTGPTIDEIFIPNLRRQPGRKFFLKGHMEARNVPSQLITWIEAIDAKHYKSNKEVIKDYIDLFREPEDERLLKADKKYLCWTITWAMILQRIIANPVDRYCMILIDDFHFRYDWGIFQKNLNQVLDSDNFKVPAKIIQVSSWDAYPGFLGRNTYRVARQPISPHSEFVYGFRGYGDSCTIVNREGAQILLDCFLNEPWLVPEAHIFGLSQKENQDGFFSTRSTDTFVVHHEILERGEGDDD